MFEKSFTLHGFEAHLDVNANPRKSEIKLSVLPFASSFLSPKASLTIHTSGDSKYENTLSLSGNTFSGVEGQAFLAAAQVASSQMTQWEAIARSLEKASDAAFEITRLATLKRWDDVILYIGLLPNPLASLSDRCNYNAHGFKASNVSAAIFRHPAFGVAKETFFSFLGNEARELSSLEETTQNMIRALYMLTNRFAMTSNYTMNVCAGMMLERDDIPGYTFDLTKRDAAFSLNSNEPSGILPGNTMNPITPATLYQTLKERRTSDHIENIYALHK